jgi:uncharacterized phage protein (TIGR02218 family)
MPRTILPTLKTTLESSRLPLAVCFRIERRDGTIFRFTSTNVRLTIDAEVYEPLDSVNPTALESKVGSGVDNLEIIGLVSSDRITERDLRAGLFDGAEVEQFIVNFLDLSEGKMILGKFTLGNVQISDGQFVAELRSLTQKLTQQTTGLISPTCRAKVLGDSECQADLTGLTDAGAVSVVTDRITFRITGAPVLARVAGWYDYGVMRMTSGENAGIEREIKRHTEPGAYALILIQEAFPFPVLATQTVELLVGCDRTFAQCVAKFDNAVNFRGEPHVPGIDKVMKRGRGGG